MALARKASAFKPAAKKMPAKKAAPKGPMPMIMTTKHFAAELSASQKMAKKDAEEFLNGFVASVRKHLKRGAKLRLTGLGILQVRNYPARMGRNPATGEPIKIKASRKIRFRPAKDLKEAI
jgi:DNA-binding protein HU-beta